MATSFKATSPDRLLIQGFTATILLGALLLMLPISSRSGEWTGPLTALFTSTSATCVTGLSVVDIGTHFSHFGQLVILGLIQLGGLGIMTIGTFLLVLVGRRLNTTEEFVLMDSIGANQLKGIRSLMWSAIAFTLVLEAIGAALLGVRLWVHGYSLKQAIYSGVFHSVSAFCNAGYSIYSDSLSGFARDPTFLLTITGLIVFGGLGFVVLYDLAYYRFGRYTFTHKQPRLHLHSKIVLVATSVLLLGGTALFALFEWNTTLAPLAPVDKLVVSLFHSATPRTAGFTVVDYGHVLPSTLFLTMGLMFIGGSPCSTAGGVKTSSIVVLLLVVKAYLGGRRNIEIKERTVPPWIFREALVIFLMYILIVSFFFGILVATEAPPLMAQVESVGDALLFEVLSATGTVGLSTGITPYLSELGKLCIIACMFIGRLGPLTVALGIGRKDVKQAIRYPDEEVLVG